MFDCDGVVVAGVVARLTLGSVFVLAGLLKVRNKTDYQQLRGALPLGSTRAMGVGLAVLPLIEILLGVFLLVGKFSNIASSIAICLLIAFSTLLFLLARAGYSHGCACFGSSDNFPVGPAHFVRNGLLLFAAVFARLQNERGCIDVGVADVPIEVIAMVVIILGVGSLTYRGLLEIQNLRTRA